MKSQYSHHSLYLNDSGKSGKLEGLFLFAVVLGLQLMLLLHRCLSPVVRFDEGGDPDPDEEDPAQDPVGHPVVVDQVEKPLGHQGADDPKRLVRRQARVRPAVTSSFSGSSTIKTKMPRP